MRLRTVTYKVHFWDMTPDQQERTRRAWRWFNHINRNAHQEVVYANPFGIKYRVGYEHERGHANLNRAVT